MPFQRGALFHLLGKRVYLGEITHKGVSHPGEHPPIIPSDLWDQVQATIERNRAEPQHRTRRTEPSLLTGILHDGEGRRMSPTHASKGMKRYRYYATPASERTANGTPAWRVPAYDVETIVVDRLRAFLIDRREMRRLAVLGDGSAASLQLAINTGGALAAELSSSIKRRHLVTALVSDVQITDRHVAISVMRPALLTALRIDVAPEISAEAGDLMLSAPALLRRVGKEVRLVVPADDDPEVRDVKVAALLAEALHVRELLLASPQQTIEQIARETGRCRSRTARLPRLAFVAPDLVEWVVDGESAPLLASKSLSANLPACWKAQQRLLRPAFDSVA